MSPPDLDTTSLRGRPIPAVAADMGATAADLVWHNEVGGMTFTLGDRFIKWSPRSSGIDLALEHKRLEWLSARHPTPRVLAWGEDADAQWMVTGAVDGRSAVDERWKADPDQAVAAIAHGLRVLHRLSTESFPHHWNHESWLNRHNPVVGPRPPITDPVLVHGDACAPNTLIGDDGSFSGHVDMGALAVGDRWADIAIAAMSLDWNYGPGFEPAFLQAYGIEPDQDRIAYYRHLWNLES